MRYQRLAPIFCVTWLDRPWAETRSLFFTGSARKSSSLIRRSSLTLYPLAGCKPASTFGP